jgi:serralysin
VAQNIRLQVFSSKNIHILSEVQIMPFGIPTSSSTVTATFDNNIDGLLSGTKWTSSSVTFSFTDSINDYETGYSDRTSHELSFQTLNAAQRTAARAWLGGGAGSFYNVSNLAFTELTGTSDRDATIRMAMSNDPPTAYAYYPGGSVEGGDAWFNRTDYNNPIIGTYAYHTFGHELGHALGLKHGQELGGVRNVAMNADRDSMEFSIMTYRSYVGAPLTGYSNEYGGYAQSLMMYDIAAIQHMYGAWFGANATNSTYTFSLTTGAMSINGVAQGTPAANRIFRTIWDGDGIDTYDFSNYTTNLNVDLTPGGWSNLDTSGGHFQQAYLGGGNYARGHVFNALQYQGDARSLIENASGGSGNDVITGNAANNVLNGGAGNDVLNGGAGNDTIYGGMGNDTADGGEGNDLIYLNDGDDYLNIVSTGNDTFYGGAGNDYIYGWTGNELYYGESGNDTLLGSSGFDSLYGGDGSDSVDGGIDNDVIDGGAGNDTIYGESGNDTVSGGDGDDLIYLGDGNDYVNTTALGNDTFYGGAGDDYIYGGSGNEIYYGEAGNDTLLGYHGNDSLWGGDGNDSLIGGFNNDTLDGGTGIDTLYGGDGDDRITSDGDGGLYYGDAGNDVMFSGIGNETMDGGVGIDQINHTIFSGDYSFNMETGLTNFGGESYLNFENTTMGAGNDSVTGSALNNVINGGSGNDSLNGAGGNDSLNGAGGNDLLTGGDGNDTLVGGAGNDTLVGSLGKDRLTGSGGVDRFNFAALNESLLASYDVITGYTAGEIIDAPALILAGTIISIGNAASLTAAGISAVLTAGSFAANRAAAFTVTGQNGTFLALNDGTAGFNSAQDSIIFLQGYTGAVTVA